jgi:uncharacterized membrane protein
MNTLFEILKWLHVLAAITALGTNITYLVWLRRAGQERDLLLFALRGVKFLDDWMANPAYVTLFLTGLAMVFITGMDITTPWLLTSLIGLILVSVTGLGGYSPTLRRQISAAEQEGPTSATYTAVARWGNLLGTAIILAVVAIVFLMVTKPPLWG